MQKDLAMNDTLDGMNILNCGFKFQNVTHKDNVKRYKIWPDDPDQL